MPGDRAVERECRPELQLDLGQDTEPAEMTAHRFHFVGVAREFLDAAVGKDGLDFENHVGKRAMVQAAAMGRCCDRAGDRLAVPGSERGKVQPPVGASDDRIAKRQARLDLHDVALRIDRQDPIQFAEIDENTIGLEDVVHRVAASDHFDFLAVGARLVHDGADLFDALRPNDPRRRETDVPPLVYERFGHRRPRLNATCAEVAGRIVIGSLAELNRRATEK